MLNEAELKEIEQRANNASEGDWNVEPTGTMSGAWFNIKDSNGELLFESQSYAFNKEIRNGDMDEEWYLKPEKWELEENGQQVYNDSLFIANAKADILILLNEVKRLKRKQLK